MPSPELNSITSPRLYSTSYSSLSNLKRTNEELRKHVAKLKMELDAEKARSKQIHRDKVAEIKKLKDYYDQERLQAVDSITEKSKSELEQELKKMKDGLQRTKEAEIKQILRYKEEELKTTRRLLIEERENAVRSVEERINRENGNKSEPSDIERRLNQEVRDLKKEKLQYEEMLRQHASLEVEQNEALKKLRLDHEKELQKISRDNRKEFVRKLNEVKSCQRTIQEKNQELARKELLISKLEQEKLQLSELTNSSIEGSFLSPMKMKEERTSIQASAEYCSKLEQRIKDLKRRNAELVSLAKKLEEKGKKLQTELIAVQSDKNALVQQDNHTLETLKRTFTMQRAKDISEHAKLLVAKDKEIANLKTSLRNASRQVVKESDCVRCSQRGQPYNQDTEESMEKAEDQINNLKEKLTIYAKERLLLEKQLSSTKTPVTSVLRTEELEKWKDICERHKKEIEKLKTNLNDLFEKHRQCKRLNDELSERQEECELLKDVLKKSEEEVDSLRASLEGSLEECESLKRIMEKQKKDYETLKQEKEKTQEALKVLENRTTELQNRVDQLVMFEREVKEIRVALENSRNLASSLQHKLANVQKTLDHLEGVEQDLVAARKELLSSQREYNHSLELIKYRDDEIAKIHQAQHEYRAEREKEEDSLRGKIKELTDKVTFLTARKCKCFQDGRETVSPTLSQYCKQSAFEEDDSIPNLVLKGRRQSADSLGDSCFTDKDPEESAASDDLLQGAGDKIAELAVSDSEDYSFDHARRNAGSATVKDNNDNDISQSMINISFESRTSTPHNHIKTNPEDMYNWLKSSRPNSLELKQNTRQSPTENRVVNGPEIEDLIFSEDENSSYSNTKRKNSGCEVSQQDDSVGGPITVYTAKHNYDPFLLSPNHAPEMELSFQAGDHLYVLGDKREDGFYLAELINGERGLVPSNYLQKAKDPRGLMDNVDGHLDGCTNDDFTEAEIQKHIGALKRRDSNDEFSLSSLSFDSTIEEQKESYDQVPPPQSFFLERQLNNSVVLSWQVPSGIPENEIKGYSVYLNKILKQTVIGSTRTKALISDVNLDKTYLASVTTLTVNEKESAIAFASLIIGKETLNCPSNLNVQVNTDGVATARWQVKNCWQCHAIFLNRQLVNITDCGTNSYVFKCLAPHTSYDVTVQSRFFSNKDLLPPNHDKLTVSTTFDMPAEGSALEDTVRDLEMILGGGLANDSRENEVSNNLKEKNKEGSRNQSRSLQGSPSTEADSVLVVDKTSKNEIKDELAESTIYSSLRDGDEGMDTQNSVKPPDEELDLIKKEIEDIEFVSDLSELSEPSELSIIKEETDEDLLSEKISHVDPDSQLSKLGHLPLNADENNILVAKTYTVGSEEENGIKNTFTLSDDEKQLDLNDDSNLDLLGHLPELPHDSSPTSETIELFMSTAGKASNSSISERNVDEISNQEEHCDKMSSQSENSDSKTGETVQSQHEITLEKSTDKVDGVYRSVTADDEFEFELADEKLKTPGISKVDLPTIDPTTSNEANDTNSTDPSLSSAGELKDVPKQFGVDNADESLLENMYFAPEAVKLKPDYEQEEKEFNNRVSGEEKNGNLDVVLEQENVIVEDNKDNAENSNTLEDDNKRNSDFKAPMQIRVFIALFSYDPDTMSPNPNAAEEELKFQQGQLIKVHGDIDEDGFYLGEIGDSQGYVPSNMVQEVNLSDFCTGDSIPPPTHTASREENDSSPPKKASEDQQNISTNASALVGGHALAEDPRVAEEENDMSMSSIDLASMNNTVNETVTAFSPHNPDIFQLPPKKMVALYDYDPQVLSPNVDAEVELGFHCGDVILVYGDMDEDGFFVGKVRDKTGLVPSNFLRKYVERPGNSVQEIEIIASPSKAQGSSREQSMEDPLDDTPKKKKKKGFFKKSKKIFSKWKGNKS